MNYKLNNKMKAEITVKQQVNLTHIEARIGVRYWEDGTVNGVEDTEGKLIPLRDGDSWVISINIDSGRIDFWPKGTTASVHYKCCDDGDYYIQSDEGHKIKYPSEYVPNILDITKEGYGDYIIFNIDENGTIENWPKNPDISEFFRNEDV